MRYALWLLAISFLLLSPIASRAQAAASAEQTAALKETVAGIKVGKLVQVKLHNGRKFEGYLQNNVGDQLSLRMLSGRRATIALTEIAKVKPRHALVAGLKKVGNNLAFIGKMTLVLPAALLFYVLAGGSYPY